MRISKKYVYDIARLSAGKIYTRDMLKETLHDFNEYLKKDNTITGRIKSLLIDRLKFATGNLYNSIRLEAQATKQSMAIGSNAAGWKVETNPVKIYLVLDTDNQDLINALLGEKELGWHHAKKLPTIKSLMSYIRGKRSYFNDALYAIKRRQGATRLLLMQRRGMYEEADQYKSGYGRFNLPAPGEGYVDPIRSMANIIKRRMELRVQKGLSPTKGSEYIFVGNYEGYDEDGKQTAHSPFGPKYKKASTPLLTQRAQKHKGEINRILETKIDKSLSPALDMYARKALGEKNSEIKDRLRKVSYATAFALGEISPEDEARRMYVKNKIENAIYNKFLKGLKALKKIKLDEIDMVQIRNQKIDYKEVRDEELVHDLLKYTRDDEFGFSGALLEFLENTLIKDLKQARRRRNIQSRISFDRNMRATNDAIKSISKTYFRNSSLSSESIIQEMRAARERILEIIER